MKNKLFKDLQEAQSLIRDGIYIVPDESNQNKFTALIIGDRDTPYHGFYMFEFNFVKPYPQHPPEVKFHNANVVNIGRLHPNCYENGKVCLSLIGTWGQNTWDPTTSSIGEILLNLKAIVFVNDPLQSGEPPYNHVPALRNGFTYSVRVLNLFDYVLGTYNKMKNDTFKESFLVFKDIIIEYVEDPENRASFIEQYNDLVIMTLLNMKNGSVLPNGRFVQAFYQNNMTCNLSKLEKMFYDVFGPFGQDESIVPIGLDLSDFNPNKCHSLVYPGKPQEHQCSSKIKHPFQCYCTKHGSVDNDSIGHSPIFLKLLSQYWNQPVAQPVAQPVDQPVDQPGLNIEKCHAKTAKGVQCSCKKKFGDFCGIHLKGQKNGVMT